MTRRCNICTANSRLTNYMYSSKWCHNFTIFGQPTTILNRGITSSAVNTFFYKFTKCASVHCRLCWYFWRVPITYFLCVMLSNSHVIQNSIIIHRAFHKTALEIWYWIIHNIAKFPGRNSQLCWSCLSKVIWSCAPRIKACRVFPLLKLIQKMYSFQIGRSNLNKSAYPQSSSSLPTSWHFKAKQKKTNYKFFQTNVWNLNVSFGDNIGNTNVHLIKRREIQLEEPRF